MRLAPYMFAIALIALRPRRGLTPKGQATLAAAGLAFCLLRLASNGYSSYLYDRAYDRELVALDHLPVGARLVSFVGETCHSEWQMTRLQHLPAIALERKLAYSNDQWSMPGAQLLTVRYTAAQRYSHDPSELVTNVQCPREWWRPVARSLAHFPRNAFDYVWLISPPRLEQGLIPVWRDPSTGSALFKVDHAVPAVTLTKQELTPPPFGETASIVQERPGLPPRLLPPAPGNP
jgi:hypothetical protein